MNKTDFYNISKFYKGESKCPYNQNTQQDQFMFWGYERKFEQDFFSTKAWEGKTLEEAFALYLDMLFPTLSDKYGAMDDGTWFQELYERQDP